MVTVYLGLGSNLGDRRMYIREALRRLRQNRIKISKLSTIIETDPVGGPKNQPKFLNAVLRARTDLKPLFLLRTLKSIENELGRKRTTKNGPRTIDIDVLLYGTRKIRSKTLTIPHPQMAKRGFVMQPLAEIAPLVAQRVKCKL